MSEFDDFIKGLGSDIKTAAEKVGKKAEETFEISKRQAERMKIKGHIQNLYQHLGELSYGSMKNGEDVSEEANEIITKLDAAFARIEEIYAEINEIKNGTFVSEEMDWEEEYAEEYDDDEEVEVSIVVMENDGEVVEEEAVIEAEEETSGKHQAFDINID